MSIYTIFANADLAYMIFNLLDVMGTESLWSCIPNCGKNVRKYKTLIDNYFRRKAFITYITSEHGNICDINLLHEYPIICKCRRRVCECKFGVRRGYRLPGTVNCTPRNEEFIIASIRKFVTTISLIHRPTHKVCMVAINTDCSKVFKYIKQTEKLCLEAVKIDGSIFAQVKIQTPEICLIAVKKCGLNLQYVKKQTEEICNAALEQNIHALQFVREQTKKMCMQIIQKSPHALSCVKKQYENLCLVAVRGDGLTLQHVKNQTEKICLAAVQQNGDAIIFVKIKTNQIRAEAYRQKNQHVSEYAPNT